MCIILNITGVPDIDRDNVLHALRCDGWLEVAFGLGEQSLRHPQVNNKQEASDRLRAIGLNLDDLRIDQHPDYEFSDTLV
jgi:hypothetical protein